MQKTRPGEPERAISEQERSTRIAQNSVLIFRIVGGRTPAAEIFLRP